MPSVRFALPAPILRRFITAYYFVDIPAGAGPLEDLLHPEWANVRFSLSGRWATRIGGIDYDPAPAAALFGPTSAAGVVRGEGGMVLGVGLLPLGWARFIAAPASQMANKVEPLATVLGDRAEETLTALRQAPDDAACVAILDALFGALDAAGPPLEPVLLKAHERLLDPAVDTVAALASALALSPRHLTRLSLRMFGFPPKLLIRRQRFLRTLHALREHPNAALGDLIDDGYFDQSHFTRDFHLFMGMSPSRYFALPHLLLGPAARERMAALGTSYQGLHARLR
jgi:AraC-like DNA-binding protein